jgi:hypothetical protein
MFVCMHVSGYVCMHVSGYVCVCVCMYECVYEYLLHAHKRIQLESCVNTILKGMEKDKAKSTILICLPCRLNDISRVGEHILCLLVEISSSHC